MFALRTGLGRAWPRCANSALVRFMSKTHYDILGVKKSASTAEIRTAFLELSKQLHPDVNAKDPKTHDKFVKLNEAYTVLSKPSDRRNYDLTMTSPTYSHHRPPFHKPSSNPGSQTHQQQHEQHHHQEYTGSEQFYQDYRSDIYSMRGMPKKPHTYWILFAISLLAFAIGLHLLGFWGLRKRYKKQMIHDMKLLEERREEARSRGPAEHMRILRAKLLRDKEDLEPDLRKE